MTESEFQDKGRELVGREVYYNVSHLVAALFKQSGHGGPMFGRDGPIDEEELMSLAWKEPDADDFSDVAPEGFKVLQVPNEPSEGQGAGLWEWFGPNSDDVYTDEGGDYFDTELEAWESAFEANNLDRPDGAEIYEHWLVSDWLGRMLQKRGHRVVFDLAGLTIWGRPTTGQAILLDGVIRDILRDIHGADAGED